MEAVRPIVFGAESIHAIEEGLKWQTRRLGLPRPPSEFLGYMMLHDKGGLATLCGPDYPDGDDDEVRCPYGKPGDILWVRESWAPVPRPPRDSPKCIINPRRGEPGEGIAGITWKASWLNSNGTLGNPSGYKFRSPRYMPRWASRMYVQIDRIRVEKIQDISEKDAVAEGIQSKTVKLYRQKARKVYLGAEVKETQHLSEHATASAAFASVWDSINGKRNPPRVWIHENGKKRIVGWKERQETPKLPLCCWASDDWIWILDFSVAWRYGKQFE